MNDTDASSRIATFLESCRDTASAFALWREPGGTTINGLRTAAPQSLPEVLPKSLDVDGFLLAPFRLAGGDAQAGHPSLFLAADGPIQSFERAGTPVTATSGLSLGSLADFTSTGPPHALSEFDYRTLVEAGVTAIQSGSLEKIVASRAEPRPLGPDYDVLGYYLRLCEAHRQAMVALVGVPGHGLWIVATPETLLSVEGSRIKTMALAGTQPLPDGADPADALWSAKFIEEQALVSRYIRAILEDVGLTLVRETGPATIRAANLAHLCSWFEVEANDATLARTVNDLVRRMHPTSAVCGMPRDAAFAFLADHEAYDRSYYSGFLGPTRAATTDRAHSAALFVNLRSAQFIGADIVLYVGAGVTGFSDPAAEWEETVQKTKTLGSLL